jgi:hypothetical protein
MKELSFIERLSILGIYLLLSLVIAYFIGSKRKIGFWWSIFFCFFLSPLFGLIITLFLSNKNAEEKSKNRTFWEYIILIFGLMAFLGQVRYLIVDKLQFDTTALYASIGIVGLGIYILIRDRKVK